VPLIIERLNKAIHTRLDIRIPADKIPVIPEIRTWLCSIAFRKKFTFSASGLEKRMKL
jgi:hypothetical protein